MMKLLKNLSNPNMESLVANNLKNSTSSTIPNNRFWDESMFESALERSVRSLELSANSWYKEKSAKMVLGSCCMSDQMCLLNHSKQDKLLKVQK